MREIGHKLAICLSAPIPIYSLRSLLFVTVLYSGASLFLFDSSVSGFNSLPFICLQFLNLVSMMLNFLKEYILINDSPFWRIINSYIKSNSQ